MAKQSKNRPAAASPKRSSRRNAATITASESKAGKRAAVTPSAPDAPTQDAAQQAARGARADKDEIGSKKSRVLAMLRSAEGATVAAMMQETGWQQHSVRGFLAGVVRKKLQLRLDSTVVDGHRVYRIVDGATGKRSSSQPKRRAA